ncbi:YihY/virulence factor BrkB family protein [Pleurocapsales cyanobacterium LEGE 06147]|nr:YihY/virulence factor BrkB family protein [Pleurocapsales cyanobacterium LEGE 06147]
MLRFRQLWKLIKGTASEWQFNEVSLLASSLAYFTIFSIAPLLIIVIMIVGAIFGEAAVQGELVGQIQDVVGKQGAQFIQTAIANVREDTDGGPFRLIFSLGFLTFGASGVFAQIQNALDKIWEVKPEPKRHIFHFIRKRLLSFAMVLVIAFLLLVSLVVNMALALLFDALSNYLPALGYLWQVMSFLLSFTIIVLVFAAMYTILPDAKVAWRDAFVGAMITAILFMSGQYLFGVFLNQTDFGSAYGVAGSLVIIITWIYYTAHILFIGAEFTKVYARQHGSKIVPEEYAVSLSSEQSTSSEQSNRQEPSQTRLRKRSPAQSNHSQRQRNSNNFFTNLLRQGLRRRLRERNQRH